MARVERIAMLQQLVSSKYSLNHIEDALIEELGELIQAIIKNRRSNGCGCHTDKTPNATFYGIKEEIADVNILLGQYVDKLEQEVQYDFDAREIGDIMERKLQRQLDRIRRE